MGLIRKIFETYDISASLLCPLSRNNEMQILPHLMKLNKVKSFCPPSTGLVGEVILMELENVLCGAQGQATQKSRAASAQQKFLSSCLLPLTVLEQNNEIQ